MFVLNENVVSEPIFMNFHDYILSESIEPVKIEFGTDFKNEQWHSSANILYTFFKRKDFSIDDLYAKANKFPNERPYVIIIDRHNPVADVGFATGDYTPKDIAKLKDHLIMIDYFDFGLRKTSKALKVINNVFYVLIKGFKKFNLHEVSFKGANSDLIYTYDQMLKNKIFLKKLNSLGFEFYKSEEDRHFLKRIQS